MTPDEFFRESVQRVFSPGGKVLDVGAGLRVDPARGNRTDPARDWIKPLLDKVEYKVMDPVDTYHPDIVGDIMRAPLGDAVYDAVICLAVLEHVPRAWDAVSEIHRIVKPGGCLFGYVPFLSPYHAMEGYYGDYVRFTDDGIRALCSSFSKTDTCHVRGPMETILHLLPARVKLGVCVSLARMFDCFYPGSGKQASGFFFFCTK